MSTSGPPFRIEFLPPCLDRVRVLTERAKAVGLGRPFAGFLAEMMRDLQRRPREWGDPFTPLHGMQAVVYQKYSAAVEVRVEYLVHDTEPEVVVRSFESLPRGPLA